MSNFFYQGFFTQLFAGNLTGTPDIRFKLCMTNTTCDTEVDVTALSGFTTIDAYDGAGYQDGNPAVTSSAWDSANDRWELDCDDFDFSSGSTVGAGTRSAAGILIYLYVDGTNANDKPLAWYDTGFPQAGTGGNWSITVNAQGLIQGRTAD